MRRLPLLLVSALVLISISASVYGPPIPPAPQNGNAVVDSLGWLNTDQATKINGINSALDRDGLAQLAVMTIDDCGSDKKGYRREVFNAWGIGHRFKNDGVLIIICWYRGNEDLRSVSQEVGSGMEEILPSQLTDRVAVEVFRPYFAVDRSGDGLVMMTVVYDKIIRKTATVDDAIKEALQPLSDTTNASGVKSQGNGGSQLKLLLTTRYLGLECFWWIVVLFFGGIVFLAVLHKRGLIDLVEILEALAEGTRDGTFDGGFSDGGGSDTGF